MSTTLLEQQSVAPPATIRETVQQDLADCRSTAAALRESERRYRALADAAHDSIFIVNRDGRIEYGNTMSGERFGIRTEDMIGKRVHDVFPAATADEMWRCLTTVFDTGERQYYENRFDTPHGDLWLGTWLVPVSGETQKTRTVMGVARDITDQKRLEKQFRQAQKMEAVGQLTGGIAHDFNNLLTPILGYSELLLAQVQDPGWAKEIGEIKKAGERATRLIRQLMTFSRKDILEPRVLDLKDVVADFHKMLGRVIGEDIDLQIRAEGNTGRVKADPGLIEQLIMNLVVNARDAMPQGGVLCVTTADVELDAEFVRRHDGATPGRYVALSVQDTGCGMTPEVLAHAFEPFFTTKEVGKGTGLGLATVYGIVKQSGGYVAIDSTPGQGTTVTTYLPIVNQTATRAIDQPEETNVPSGTETVLLVEDEASVRQLMEYTLQHRGYRVLSAANAAEALAMVESRKTPIDLLLTDVVMPGLSGPDLADQVGRILPDIRLLFVSGFPNVGGRRDQIPRAQLVMKPFTASTLCTKVRQSLDGQRVGAEVVQ